MKINSISNKVIGHLFVVTLLIPFGISCKFLDASKAKENNTNQTQPAPTVSENKTAPAPNTESVAKKGDNLLSLAKGAFVVKFSSEESDGVAFKLIDDHVGSYGSILTKEGVKNGEYVIALAEKTSLDTLELWGTDAPSDNESAKDVEVQMSDTSAETGFETIANVTMQNPPINKGQTFPVSKKVAGRWLKVIIKNNYGGNSLGFSEIKGYGEVLTKTPLTDISGTYNANMYYGVPEVSEIFLKQTGSSVEGCVVSTNTIDKSKKTEQILSNGTLINNSLLAFTQNTLDHEDKITKSYPAILVFSPDRQKFYSRIVSILENPDDFYSQDTTLGKRISEKVGDCPQWTAKKSTLADELEESGRVRFYGINFDTDSDVIKAESYPALDKIVQVAKERPDWNFIIEGHTDAVADDAHNQTLSEKRAASVKTYLVKAGVAENRLETKGYGETKPIADNNGEIGRTQNRRVELVKK
jgi:outer membrane protein OmpA-like peptidoglycan-associated protein